MAYSHIHTIHEISSDTCEIKKGRGRKRIRSMKRGENFCISSNRAVGDVFVEMKIWTGLFEIKGHSLGSCWVLVYAWVG